MRINKLLGLTSFFFLALFFISCDESLPTRSVPENTLAIQSFTVSQGLAGNGRFILPMRITIRNIYDETFEDSVLVNGQIRAWWKAQPTVGATLRVGNGNLAPQSKLRNGVLKLDAGEDIYIDQTWFFFTDNNEDILDKLDYSQNNIQGNFIYADPDTFVFEAVVRLYGQLGPLVSSPVEFEVTGMKRLQQ